MRTLSTALVLAAFMIVAAINPAQAQDTPKKAKVSRWTIGPKVGVNLTHFWGNDFDNDDAKMKVGPQFGGFFTWSNDSWFAVSGELLYSAKGSRFRIDSPFGDVKSVTRMDYLEIPLLFRFFFVKEGAVRPHVSIGPSVGFLVLGRSKTLEPIESEVNNFYDSETTHKFDVGLNAGGGVNIRVADRIWINPELRYNLGLLNIADNYNVRNGALTFSVGVGFPIGKK